MSGQAKLLLVSHDHDRLITLRKLLTPLADEALMAHSGRAALDLCRGHDVAAVLMDVEPLENEGLETAQQIHSQEHSRQTPIIFLTSEMFGRQPGSSQTDGGPVDFMPKAASAEALKQKVEEYARATSNGHSGLELERRVEDLTQSNEALHEFTWAASHDLKEPLRNVLMLSERLARAAGEKLGVNERETLDLICEHARRTCALIEAMQQYIYVGEAASDYWTEIDCNAIVRTAVAQLRRMIRETGASVSWEALPTIWSSEILVTQVFQNLIGNSIKYRSAEPPVVRISCDRRGQEWVFSVKDNGIGIDPIYAEYIFQPFKRLHSKKSQGTGIGLAICRAAVRRMGGSIWLESGCGSGSRFRFTLPDKGIPQPE